MSDIPVIDFSFYGLDGKKDLSEADLNKLGKIIVEPLSGIGFVYLKNVGIKKELINKVNKAFEIFFQSPLQEKKKYSMNPTTYHGYIGQGDENVNPYKSIDNKEAFNIHGAALAEDEEFPWPNNLSPQLSAVCKEFMTQCKFIAHRLLEAIAFGLDLDDKQYFVDCHSLMHERVNPTTLKGSYYDPMPDNPPGQIRLGEHCDYETVTLLFQDDTGGLQVKNLQGEYVDATPIKDTVLVNIADTLQFWSKYKLKSTKHRVVSPVDPVKRNRLRQSLAYFIGANDGTIIDDLPLMSESKEYEEMLSHIEGKVTTDKFLQWRISRTMSS